MAEGITKLHSRGCPAKEGGRCGCNAGYEASVWSRRDGKKIRRTFPRRAEAKSWRAEARRSLDQGTLRAPAPLTVGRAAEAWLEGAESGAIRNRSGLPYKASTIRGYRQALEDHVISLLGSQRLSSVTTSDLQDLVDRWQAENRPASTIRNSIKPLQAIYRRARSREGLPVNPTQDLELPAPRPKEVEIVAPDVAGRLLDALPIEGRPVWATALYAGLRYGELRALREGALDFAAGTIAIRESWDPREGTIDPKTRTSRRTVPMPAILREQLLDHRLRRGDRGDRALVFGEGEDRPFNSRTLYDRADAAWEVDCARMALTDDLGRLDFDAKAKALHAAGHSNRAIARVLGVNPTTVYARLKGQPEPTQAATVTKLRLHQARHTYASFMIAANVNAKALAAYMGHSSIKVTFDLYGHLMPGNEEEAASLLDAYLDRADTKARLAALDAGA